MLMEWMPRSRQGRDASRFVLLMTAILWVPAVTADDEIKNVSDFGECRSLADDARRLLCYDTIADGGVFNEQKVQEAVEESFGANESQQSVSTDELSVSVIRVSEGAGNVHYFYTESGSVWKQTNGRSWKVKAPFNATIKSGVFSSYFLVSDSGKSTRVKRVR